MKTLRAQLYIGLIFFIQLGIVQAGELADAVEAYKERLNATIHTLPADANPAVVEYLQTCLTIATGLSGIDDSTPNVTVYMKDVANLRNAASKKLVGGTSGAQAVRDETAAYNDTLQPLFANDYLAWVALQNELLERKYFNTKTAKTGNFLEAYINGQWKLTSADPNRLRDRTPPRPLGVSPWEAIFRFEPTVAMRDGGQAAIMATGGMSYTFFPNISEDTPPKPVESFRSKWLKKTGFRGGLGAGHIDSKTRLLVGSGIQLNAIGIWVLYEPKQETWLLGLSTADLSKLKKAIAWFD